MLLDIGKDITKGERFEFDDDVAFIIRHSSPEFVRKSRAKHLKNKPGRGEVLTKQSEKEWDKDLWDHIIEDWEGILIGGKPAPCTLENKMILVNKSQAHQAFCFEISTDISNFMDKAKLEEEEKN